jgi:hypothetical protein
MGASGARPDGQRRFAGSRGGKIKDGRHVGLDFYDLLIEGLRRFISTTASINSWAGPFGQGRPPRWDENNMWYFRFVSELWTTRLLAKHVRKHAGAAGHASLAKLGPRTVTPNSRALLIHRSTRGRFVPMALAISETVSPE